MKKFIHNILFISILFIGVLSAPVEAMQNDRYRRGDKITLIDGRRVEFVSVDRPENTRGLEQVIGLGWVKIISWGQRGGNQNGSSVGDKLTDEVLSHGIAFGTAWLIGWLKKEAVEERFEGSVALAPIVIDLLSDGVWDTIKELPATLLMLGLDHSWSREEKNMIKATTNLVTSKFTEKYEYETEESIEELVTSLGFDGLYIDPKRVSDILHKSAKAWDEASGLRRRGTNGTGGQQPVFRQPIYRGQSNAQVTTAERNQIRGILGRTLPDNIQKNIKKGFVEAIRNQTFTGNFGQYLLDLIEGAKDVGMQDNLMDYIKIVYN